MHLVVPRFFFVVFFVYIYTIIIKTITYKSKTMQITLTSLEEAMLLEICKDYDVENNECFIDSLSKQAKGVIGSLVKKNLIYDSFEDRDLFDYSNFFPMEHAYRHIESIYPEIEHKDFY